MGAPVPVRVPKVNEVIFVSDWIGVAFGIGGILLASHCLVVLIAKGRDVGNWVNVDGHLEELDVHGEVRDIRGSGLLYRATVVRARYSYAFGAARFVGHCVTLMDFRPIVGIIDCSDMVGKLKDAYAKSEPVRVFVNPRIPTEAVLARPGLVTPIVAWSLILMVSGGIFSVQLLRTEPTSIVTWVFGTVIGIGVYLTALFR
jgi:uncharacterized protein DUF3592